MRLILASALCAFPAHADDSAMWNGTGCQLVPVEGQAHVAEVRCRNILTPWREQPTTGEMEADGITVRLSLFEGYQTIPDEFTIIPPDGFVAVPSVLVLDEDETGVVLIVPFLGY